MQLDCGVMSSVSKWSSGIPLILLEFGWEVVISSLTRLWGKNKFSVDSQYCIRLIVKAVRTSDLTALACIWYFKQSNNCQFYYCSQKWAVQYVHNSSVYEYHHMAVGLSTVGTLCFSNAGLQTATIYGTCSCILRPVWPIFLNYVSPAQVTNLNI